MKERSGRVTSGDVELFYRAFGEPGKTPIVILMPANYFDSADFIEVAGSLADDREVAVLDARGFGGSSWSAGKDYTHAANVSDVIAVLDALGWGQAAILGISRGGAFGVLAASRFPDRISALILAAYMPAVGIGHPGAPVATKQLINLPVKVFPTIEEAVAATERESDVSVGSPGRARAEEFLAEVDGGYRIATRDPDFPNPIPLEPGDWPIEVPIAVDNWAELAKVEAPVRQIKVGRSRAQFSDQDVERMAREFPDIHTVEIEATQDITATGADELVGAVKDFLTEVEA